MVIKFPRPMIGHGSRVFLPPFNITHTSPFTTLSFIKCNFPEVSAGHGYSTSNSDMNKPLITCPVPILNLKGLPLSLEESNFFPSVSVPGNNITNLTNCNITNCTEVKINKNNSSRAQHQDLPV